MTDDVYVGYYYGGIKLFSLVFGIVDSLTAILLPRFSNLMAEEMKNLLQSLKKYIRLLLEFLYQYLLDCSLLVNMLYLFWVVIVLYHL